MGCSTDGFEPNGCASNRQTTYSRSTASESETDGGSADGYDSHRSAADGDASAGSSPNGDEADGGVTDGNNGAGFGIRFAGNGIGTVRDFVQR
jgi:hypothetical protein